MSSEGTAPNQGSEVDSSPLAEEAIANGVQKAGHYRRRSLWQDQFAERLHTRILPNSKFCLILNG